MKTPVTNKNKKTGLGRGLGSLLGADPGAEIKKTPTPAQIRQAPDNTSKSTNNLSEKHQQKPENAKIISRPNEPVVQTDQAQKTASVKIEAPRQTISIPPVETTPEKKESLEGKVLNIDIEKIFANEDQPRKVFDKEALQTLANSIKEQGLLQPITVKPAPGNRFEIIAGERRWRATQLAGLFRVPAIVKLVNEQKTLELALIENIQREDLNAIEEAMAYKHLMDKYDLTQSELAKKMGKERATIANLLRLLNLGPEVREMVSRNEISMGQAKLLLTLSDFRLQFKIARKIVKNKMTVRQVEKLIKRLQSPNETNDKAINTVSVSHINSLKAEMQKIIGTKVDLNYKDGKSKLQIQFYSDEELNGFIDKMRKTWNQI